jgi:diguanylate cyclase (GGDEF)-like protein
MATKQPDLEHDLAVGVLNQLPAVVLVCDNQGAIVWHNASAVTFLGRAANDLLKTNLSDLEKTALVSSDEQNALYTVSGVTGAEPQRWLKRHEVKLSNAVAIVYEDVTEAQRLRRECQELEEKLDQLSTIDPVSGLLNRRAMLQNLEPLVSRSRRYDNPLSVIAMDLLNLGDIRQQHGEDAVNHAVKQISYMLKDQLRWADLVSRPDPERFVLILPETGKEAATHLAEKVRDSVDALSVDFNGNELQVHVCFGVSAWEKGNDSVLLLRHANQSAELAKQNGPGSIQDS